MMKKLLKEWDVFHERVLHVQQSQSWDCGIACVKMALSACKEAGVWANSWADKLRQLESDQLTNFGNRFLNNVQFDADKMLVFMYIWLVSCGLFFDDFYRILGLGQLTCATFCSPFK